MWMTWKGKQLVGDCQTNIAGPGFHAAVVYFLELFAARGLSLIHIYDEFDGFAREKRLDLVYVCFTDYDETIANKLVAFRKESITNTFGEYLAAHGKTQVRIAETEKYAHVTFFFNGGVEEPNEGEDRILVPSPKEVATYDLKPEMSAPQVCDKLVEAIKSGKYDVVIINFANPDMVGHTGVAVSYTHLFPIVLALVIGLAAGFGAGYMKWKWERPYTCLLYTSRCV